jgi:RHS repeat-associated protein
VSWPGYSTTAWYQGKPPQEQNRVYMGTVLEGQRDASGQMYMRNRMYDPATGQFTQTDPIGIAGGLNTYGFADGDPVSYSDPYGLKADSIPAAFRSKLGNLCQEVDCDKAQIHFVGWMPADKAMTLGNHMFFGRRLNPNRVGDVALLAHELTHVGDFQEQPSFLSALEVATTFPLGATPGGLSPYNWKQYPLGSWQEYNLESRAQIVQDCFRLGSGSLACEISPYRPPNYDPSVYVPGNP